MYPDVPLLLAVSYIVGGLLALTWSANRFVDGASSVARQLGVSQFIIGMVVIGFGTSLPELASAVAAARKGKHDFVLGNIIGSNFFNTLAVVGLSGAICPFRNVSRNVLTRDLGVMVFLTLSIALFGINFKAVKREGRISRVEGAFWLALFIAYLVSLCASQRA